MGRQNVAPIRGTGRESETLKSMKCWKVKQSGWSEWSSLKRHQLLPCNGMLPNATAAGDSSGMPLHRAQDIEIGELCIPTTEAAGIGVGSVMRRLIYCGAGAVIADDTGIYKQCRYETLRVHDVWHFPPAGFAPAHRRFRAEHGPWICTAPRILPKASILHLCRLWDFDCGIPGSL